MNTRKITSYSLKRDRPEFQFIPRIINPVKMSHAIIFSAEEQVRRSGESLKENMPWIEIKHLHDPVTASNFQSNGASVFLFDDTAMTLVDTVKIRQRNKDAIVVLLSSNRYIHCSPPSAALEKYPYTEKADLVFAIDRRDFSPGKIITSVVRSSEDLLNIEKYSKVKRFIFLIVDDEPRWFSQFLPLLYKIIGQRADVMITRTYEETLRFLLGVERESEIDPERYRSFGHGDNVVCLITDIFFPKGKDLTYESGRDLVKLTRRYYPRYPIIVASKAKEAGDLKDLAFIMPKGDPGSLLKLEDYILNFTGMGDFLIRDDDGNELYRIKDIQEMFELMLEAEKDAPQFEKLRERLEAYERSDNFSTWLYMHSYRDLGDTLRPKRTEGKELVTVLKRHLKREILRMIYTPLIIDGIKVYNLNDLLKVIRTIDPGKIQQMSDNDIFSSWLDRKGYPELAEELRPIHGIGSKLGKALAEALEKWIEIYQSRGREI
jgi:hypothetical protein